MHCKHRSMCLRLSRSKSGKVIAVLDLGVPIALEMLLRLISCLGAIKRCLLIKITEIISEDRLSVIEIENIVNHARFSLHQQLKLFVEL
ncbi:hypothetical protein [Ignatzschineria indica]|uniref:hypothetical protein n=1 Tax=Ignatzschineria indica TaxID=472583 RepID=UPI0036344EDD